jgi:uncharacterized repeat protein (TIGR01451 family)
VMSGNDPIDVRYRFDLHLSISDDHHTAQPGEWLTYTVRLTNVTQLPITATGIAVYEYLEPGLPDFAPAGVSRCVAPCSGWNLVGELDDTTIYSRVVPFLGPNQSTTLTFSAQVSPTLSAEAPNVLAIGNYAEAYADNLHGVESDPTNQGQEDLTIVSGPDLAASGLRASFAHPVPGQPFSFYVNVANLGLDPTVGPDGTGSFGVDLYVRPAGSAPPFGPSDRYLGACPTLTSYCPDTFRIAQYQTTGIGGLTAGGRLPLTYTLSITPEGVYWVYVQADTYGSPYTSNAGTPVNGRMLEGDELNNIVGPLEIKVSYYRVYLPIMQRK